MGIKYILDCCILFIMSSKGFQDKFHCQIDNHNDINTSLEITFPSLVLYKNKGCAKCVCVCVCACACVCVRVHTACVHVRTSN